MEFLPKSRKEIFTNDRGGLDYSGISLYPAVSKAKQPANLPNWRHFIKNTAICIKQLFQQPEGKLPLTTMVLAMQKVWNYSGEIRRHLKMLTIGYLILTWIPKKRFLKLSKSHHTFICCKPHSTLVVKKFGILPLENRL